MSSGTLIPNMPPIQQELTERIDTPFGKKYQLNSGWHSFFSELVTTLQKNFSAEGISLPQQPTTNINLLNNTSSVGAIIYDSTANVAKININGVWKTITTS